MPHEITTYSTDDRYSIYDGSPAARFDSGVLVALVILYTSRVLLVFLYACFRNSYFTAMFDDSAFLCTVHVLIRRSTVLLYRTGRRVCGTYLYSTYSTAALTKCGLVVRLLVVN